MLQKFYKFSDKNLVPKLLPFVVIMLEKQLIDLIIINDRVLKIKINSWFVDKNFCFAFCYVTKINKLA